MNRVLLHHLYYCEHKMTTKCEQTQMYIDIGVSGSTILDGKSPSPQLSMKNEIHREKENSTQFRIVT